MAHAAARNALVGTLLLAGVGAAPAETLRCGQRLIEPGASKAYVARRCGEPDYREVINYPAAKPTLRVEQWYYAGDSTRFARLLTFRGLRLESIELVE